MKFYRVRALFTVLVRFPVHTPVHTPVRTPMYGLPLSHSHQRIRSVFQSEYNNMLLLTNCEVHTGKYLDRSFEVRTERSEVRTKS